MTDKPEANNIPEKPGSYAELLAQLSPEIYQRLLSAVELGKWENGERLSPEQLEHCMQAIIVWDHRNLPETERVAYIDHSKKKPKHEA